MEKEVLHKIRMSSGSGVKRRPRPNPTWRALADHGLYSNEEETEATLRIAQEITKRAMIPDLEPDPEVADSSYIELPQNLTAMDPVVLHTVQLNAYATELERMIEDIDGTPNTSDSLNLHPTAPEIPKMIKPITKKCSTSPFVQFDTEVTDFSVGSAEPELRLSITNARRFLKKSAATLFAHAGFEETSELALDVLTDVVSDLYDKISKRLRVAVDQEEASGQSGFLDPLERVFTEMNLGSVKELFGYYNESVLEYHDRLEKECKDYAHEYELRVESELEGQTEAEQEEGSVPEEGMDEETDDEDVPEIHLPALDMEGQLELQPTLESGFQILNSLEYDET